MAAARSKTSSDSSMTSPKDAKKVNEKGEDAPRKETIAEPPRTTSPSGLEKADPVKPPEPPSSDADTKPSVSSTSNGAASNGQPLGPPPRPTQQNQSDTPDYFNGSHNTQQGPYQAEPNPFEAQFGNPSVETPGKSLLPPLSSLTSPQPLNNGVGTPGWHHSLRTGPLSPAMLTGPTGGNDYFDQSFSRGFPTPNESSLRSGLTPGGGGSMFPAPSPNSQALFNSLQSGGATPSTLDFYRTSLNAKSTAQGGSFAPTSQPTDPNLQPNMSERTQQQSQQEQYGQQHADADAVNGLYMLAQANGMRNTNQFAAPGQPSSVQTSMAPAQSGTQSQDSPVTRRALKGSIGSISMSGREEFSDSGRSEAATKPATRLRGKKVASAKSNRRKAEDTPAKTPANKRAKANNGGSSSINQDMMMMSDDDEVDNSPMADTHPNGKKMTDEEKRKNFLERNRVAALKCRQRKKQWLANLQAKVELFSTENDALSQTVTQLREELVNLKSIMIAHKDCPVAQQQGLAGPNMGMYLGTDQPHANPYGMAMQGNGMPHMQMANPQQIQQAQANMQASMQRSHF